MIFVTVGTSTWDFSRLIREIDLIAGKINEDIIIQIGNTQFEPKNATFFKFKGKVELEKYYRSARIVVCHDGAGSILNCLMNNKNPIVVPRLLKYAEVQYNNKAELAVALENIGKIKIVWDVTELFDTINSFDNIKFNPSGRDKNLIDLLKNYLDKLADV